MRRAGFSLAVLAAGGMVACLASAVAAGCPSCVGYPTFVGCPCCWAPSPFPPYCGPPIACCQPYPCGVSCCTMPSMVQRLMARQCQRDARRAARLARRSYRACGYVTCLDCGCPSGCGYACAGSAGYSAGCPQCLEGGAWGGSGDGEVIYDGPAEGYRGQGAESVESGLPTSARLGGLSPYRLVSNRQASGAASFEKGLALYRSSQHAEALERFEDAMAAEPENAFFQYHLALAVYSLYGPEAAGEALAKAVALERRAAIPNWGRRMERVQGRSRLWLENARREAGLSR